MNNRHGKRISILVLLVLSMLSCQLLNTDPAPEDVLEDIVAQTMTALEGRVAETPGPSTAAAMDAAELELADACQLVFVSEQQGVWDILALDFNTRQLRQLTAHDQVETQLGFMADADTIGLSVSPDGGQLAFNSDEAVNHAVYVLNLDGGHRQAVGFNIPSNDSWPTWSPDGGYLAFQSDRDGDEQIYVMDLDGLVQERLTDTADAFLYPAWSPDGRQIAVVSRDTRDLYVLDVDSGYLTRLTDDAAAYGPPDWSPDGTQLVFSTNLDGSRNIFVLEVATGALVQLTGSSGMDRFPAWSPDGEWIAFSSDWEGWEQIYLIPAVGGAMVRLTNHVRRDLAIAWLPGCAGVLAEVLEGWHGEVPPLAEPEPPPADSGPPAADQPSDLVPEDPGPESEADQHLDPVSEDPVLEPEADGIQGVPIPVVDQLLRLLIQLGQRLGIIPYEEDQNGSTIWEDILGGLSVARQEPGIPRGAMGGTPETGSTPTVEEEEDPDGTPEPDPTPPPVNFGPAYFHETDMFLSAVFGINCSGIPGTWHVEIPHNTMGCSGPAEDSLPDLWVILPRQSLTFHLPPRDESCFSESECDWYSDPVSFSYKVERRCFWDANDFGYEDWEIDVTNARMAITSYRPGVEAHFKIIAESIYWHIHSWNQDGSFYNERFPVEDLLYLTDVFGPPHMEYRSGEINDMTRTYCP
jgi:Tol biopolymer transport system component